MVKNIQFRQATFQDLELLAELESACFSKAEAASKERICERLKAYASCFMLMIKDHDLIGMINGMRTFENSLRDEMYENTALHSEDGTWQMVFSVCIAPKEQGRGLGHVILQKYIEQVHKNTHCQGLVLTCKERLLKFYAQHDFKDEGLSCSEHGDVQWHQMRLTFKN